MQQQQQQPPEGWIRLNVGGSLFSTTRQTLVSDPNSMLGRMFADDTWNTDRLPRDDTGAFLIDADPTYFRPVLNWLRRGELCADRGVSMSGVLAEAKYFGVQSLVDLLEKKTQSAGQQPTGITWADIGGLRSVKKELQQVVEHSVKYRDLFHQCGVSPSKNLLLYGPPGCGKTLLAKATANEISANFLLVKCPELLGEPQLAPQLLADKFAQARELQPCVMFLEEFECLARRREASMDHMSDPVISQMAISLDFIDGSDNVFVIAATNRPDLIEPALLRPGRFDQLIYIPLPSESARVDILRAALRQAAIAPDVDLDFLARATHRMSGADLNEICQRACKFAIREAISAGSEHTLLVTKQHFELAMTYARRSVSDKDIYRLDNFNKILLQISSSSFQFPSVPDGAESPIAHNDDHIDDANEVPQ